MSSRRWVFVINNYNDEQEAFVKQWTLPEYLVVGKEVGDSGTPHLQGYCVFRNMMAADTLQRHLSSKGAWPGAWHKPARGGPAANLKYSSKENLIVEHGQPPPDENAKGSKPKDSSLADYARAVRRRTGLHQLWEEHSSVMIRYNGGCASMRAHYAEQREKPLPKIFIAWGATGTGKSRWAVDSFGRNPAEVYWVTPGYGRMWWGGYDGQRACVIDDFTPDCLPLHHFKLLCDRYAYRVEGKGTQTPFTSRFICFTSNVDPKKWYRTWEIDEADDVHWQAVQRRIKDCATEFDGIQSHLPWRPVKEEVIDVDELEEEDQ